ncbi:MAG: hypothetical protein K2X38_19710 [Gemmataceae bacterium]|nr:hypothetical protein [Gemmataceae bacterium]
MSEDAVREGTPETSDASTAFSETRIEPGLLAPEPIETKEQPPERIENVGRAFRSAIFGLFFPPLMFLALYLLFLVYGDHEPLPPESRRRTMIASVISWPAAIAMTLVMLGLCVIAPRNG